MANASTLTLFLGNIGGQIGGIDGAINASVSASAGDEAGTVSGAITAIGNAAGMFPGALGAYGGFAVTMSNLAKTGFDGSKLTIADVWTIGAGVAALVGAPLIGFGLTVAGLGWTVYTLRNPSKNLTLSDLFNRAKNWTWPRDPIILDLGGDGLETVGLEANIHFDHNGDGVLIKTGWAGKGDALLVWDRNGNGTIDTGAELFGDFTPLPNGTLAPNGFAALAALDSNGDGILDANDLAFAELRLWRDGDQNGISAQGEMISLADAGVASLNLSNALTNQRLANGNTLSREGSFTRADGSVGAMGEFRLAIDTFDTRFAEAIEVPESLRSLPDMGGSGKVRNLQQAAALSDELAAVIADFQAATGHAERWALLDQLLTAWAGTSGMAGSLDERAAGKYRIVYEALGNERRESNFQFALAGASAASAGSVSGAAAVFGDAANLHLSESYRDLISEWNRKLHVLESFNGQYFFNLPEEWRQTESARSGLAVQQPGTGSGSTTARLDWTPQLNVNFSQNQLALLQQAYDNLKESVYASLVMQTRLRPYLDALELVIDDTGLRLDAGQLEQMLADKRAADPENHLADLLALDRYAGRFLAGTNWRGLAQFDSFAESLPQTAAVAALLAHFNVRTLGEGDDRLVLTREADFVLAGAGDDTLYGDTGNDRLFGQAGDDRLYGGDGDDLLSGGAGDDLLHGESGADTYVFGRGFGNDIISDTAEQGVRRDSVRFLGLAPADVRTTVDEADNLAFTIVETGETLRVPAAGYWWGPNGVGQYVFDDGTVWSHEDALRAAVAAATGNDDLIHGSSAADTIAGLAGNDTLIGGEGDDVLDGGAGDDLLIGATAWEWVDESRTHRRRTATPQISANGNDTYLFGRGDGRDTVIDGDATPGNIDTLRFKEGVAPTDVRISRSGNDLVLAIRDSSDQVVLARYFDETWGGTSRPYLIERIAFADGTVLSFTDVQAILFAGSDAAELIIGSRGADVLAGQGGDDVLLGGGRARYAGWRPGQRRPEGRWLRQFHRSAVRLGR